MKYFIFLILLVRIALSQEINLTGKVTNQTGIPIEGAVCELTGVEMETQTDALGNFTFSGNQIVNSGLSSNSTPYLQGNRLLFHIKDRSRRIQISLKDIRGRQLGQEVKKWVSPGYHEEDLFFLRKAAPQNIHFIRLQIGDDIYHFKITGIAGSGEISLAPNKSASLSKKSAGIDSIHCYIRGYENAVIPVDHMTGTVPDINLQPGVSFEPFFKGSGEIVDLATRQTIKIPYEKRLHTVVFAEGYTQEDLENGEYDDDFDDWFEDVFTLDIMDYFKEACVVWKFYAPSNEHLTGDGTVDSYFKLPLAGGLMAGSGYDEPAAITWEALSYFPFPASDFPSRLYARNIVASYILFDSDRGRSGFSGQARSFTHPDDNDLRVNVAMARGHDHEFMHAMAKVSDEYYDRGHRPAGSSSLRQESRYISNVVSSNACDSVPWAHLFAGSEFNPSTDSLIGAFGTNGRFHPELKCLMNGSHHNADLYGGSNLLRTNDRMCNWCRELVSFRIYERIEVLPEISSSWDAWVSSYRGNFYSELGFIVPEAVPQENSEGTGWFLPCTTN